MPKTQDPKKQQTEPPEEPKKRERFPDSNPEWDEQLTETKQPDEQD